MLYIGTLCRPLDDGSLDLEYCLNGLSISADSTRFPFLSDIVKGQAVFLR